MTLDTTSNFDHFFRLFGGLVEDVKRRYPKYISDLRDSVHLQCLAALVFMYIACLTPVVTIGGLLGQATDNNMVCICFESCILSMW